MEEQQIKQQQNLVIIFKRETGLEEVHINDFQSFQIGGGVCAVLTEDGTQVIYNMDVIFNIVKRIAIVQE